MRNSIGHWDGARGQKRYAEAYDRAFSALPQTGEALDVRTEFGVVRCYRFAGADTDNLPMVLLPGTASATPMWADNLPSLLKLGDVYTIDLLGEPGLSIQTREIIDHVDQAAWLAQVLERLAPRAFHLTGVSFGGWSAVNLAVHSTEKVASLTLIDPAMTFARLPLELIVRSLPATVRWFPRAWRNRFNSYMAGGASVDDEPIAEMIEAGMKHYVTRQPAPRLFSAEQLRRITVPVLAIISGDSAIHDSATAAEVARRVLPEATVHVYQGASHAVNGEQPERIASDLELHLEAYRQHERTGTESAHS